ncbi:hypothetical protein [Miltoncostaea oceani]|uniref:hypothetical protein n=1 Tax=Miltoncostaea oceani TaxID=2843216 RepID=UPI001C3D6229|nr:hypothetical protein [Miltoncostaea oceani]
MDHMTSHAIAANSPVRSERRAAKKASKHELSELLDTLKALGLGEGEARELALGAYRDASAGRPPISDLVSLEAVAEDAWSRIIDTLDSGGYIHRADAIAFMRSHEAGRTASPSAGA